MALSTDARDEIATALRSAGIEAFPFPPETPTLPSAIVLPDDPYLIPNRVGVGLTYSAAYSVDCLAQALDNEAGLAAVEALIDSVLAALPNGVTPTRVSRPVIESLGAQGNAYVSSIQVTAQLTEKG